MTLRGKLIGGIAPLFIATFGTRSVAETPAPTWAQDMAPLVYQHCVECHRPGGVGPFSLLTFEDSAKRARGLARATESRAMPPWLPSGPRGAFHHERGLTPDEIARFAAWSAAGAPPGDLAVAPAPPPAPEGGWRLGPPDVIVRMPRAFEVPAGPEDVYRSFPIRLPASVIPAEVIARARIPDTDVLGVAAVEIHPGNRQVVHHAHVWVDTTGEARRREVEEGGVGYVAFGNPGFPNPAYLGGYVPGTTPQSLPPGIAETYTLGGDIVLQIHYSPSGKAELDQTEVGIYFVREPIKRTVEWLRLGSFNIEIPPGVAEHAIEDELVVPADCFVLSISPHMHLLGRKVSSTARLPDGTVTELLTIPDWDFAWQDRYLYRAPLFLPRGTRVTARWIYDNGAGNSRNPHDPARQVHFGPNTSDEMCELHLFVIPLNLEDYAAFPELMKRLMAEKVAELTPDQRHRYGFDRLAPDR